MLARQYRLLSPGFLRCSPVRAIILIWAAWAAIVLAYQSLAAARLQLSRPDYALQWTRVETDFGAQRNKPYLLDPFMNYQVSWDSEFYLSIATVGYDDPNVRALAFRPGQAISLNYAFFPFYPLVTRMVAFPLRLLDLTPVATATLAGVLVSLLGTLGGMLALYDLARDRLGEAGGVRAAFYLVIFPSGFFLAQVYTEGLFVGLAFGCLALIKRDRLLLAGLLAMMAVWTRAVGVLLMIPLALAWWGWLRGRRDGLISWAALRRTLAVLLPAAAYLLWWRLFGSAFQLIEESFFFRGMLLWEQSIRGWSAAFASLRSPNPQTASYYALEFGGMLLALAAGVLTLRRYPGVALFSLGVLVVSFTSGVPQSMIRYVLTAPSIYLFLSHLGKHAAFDRAWTIASVLLLGLLATLFTFDLWVA